ncbi:MAG: hypothetical protein HUK03_05790, partial [Bacteroidaceae bacterium]|nr:hypothetical protein [Bacteroidaceae bacterium]
MIEFDNLNPLKDRIGYFTLLDETKVVCHLKDKSQENQHSADANQNSGNKPDPEGDKRDEAFFLEHAFFFWENRERIMSDSRMLFASVPIECCAAYFSYPPPTLGTLIELWLYGTIGGLTRDEQGKEALAYKFTGGLSTMNTCRRVYPDGHVEKFSIDYFKRFF